MDFFERIFGGFLDKIRELVDIDITDPEEVKKLQKTVEEIAEKYKKAGFIPKKE